MNTYMLIRFVIAPKILRVVDLWEVTMHLEILIAKLKVRELWIHIYVRFVIAPKILRLVDLWEGTMHFEILIVYNL